MKHICIAVVAMMAASFSTGQVAAQFDYGPEAEGAEPSPYSDPDEVPDDSKAELEEIEAMDGKQGETEAAAPEGDRKRRGCAVDPGSSTPSEAPITALLLAAGLIAFRRLQTVRVRRQPKRA